MRILILTEGSGELITNVTRSLRIFFPDAFITIAQAKSYHHQRKGYLSKISFILSKLKRRGFAYYLDKIRLSLLNQIVHHFQYEPSFESTLKLYNINHAFLEDHSLESLKPYFSDLDFCLVIGCRILSKDICFRAPHDTFVVHSCDPRLVKGVCLPAFWETIYGLTHFRLSLIRLAPVLDSGEIIYQEEFLIDFINSSPDKILTDIMPLMIIKSIMGYRNILDFDSSTIPTLKKSITRKDLNKFRQMKKRLTLRH